MTGEPGDDRRVDGPIEPVRLGLAGDQHAEDGYQDGAAGGKRTGPRTGGRSQQGPAGPCRAATAKRRGRCEWGACDELYLSRDELLTAQDLVEGRKNNID